MYRKVVASCFGNMLLHFELKLALNNFDTKNNARHLHYAMSDVSTRT